MVVKNILTGHPDAVAREIEDFLKGVEYKSFVSMPLRLSGEIIGVVNIDSNKPYILGRNPDKVEELKRYIAPLVSILAILSSPRAAILSSPRAAILSSPKASE